MTNTATFHALPAGWILGRDHVIMPLRLTRTETTELLKRVSEFWTLDAPGFAFSVTADRLPYEGGIDVRVEGEGSSRICTKLSDVMFTFYQDVNNDVIPND